MASLAGVSAGARGRRALDATMNLVPFIDLLSCCIAFLLITAVWTTVARVDVATAGRSVAGEEEAPATAPPWTLYVARDGWSLRAPDGATLAAAHETLAELLRAHAVAEPLVVRASDDVSYATLVDALDVARAAGIRTISLAGDGE
jgi:biopolymer transport protein ExbD